MPVKLTYTDALIAFKAGNWEIAWQIARLCPEVNEKTTREEWLKMASKIINKERGFNNDR